MHLLCRDDFQRCVLGCHHPLRARPVLTGCILLVGLGTVLFALGGGFESALVALALVPEATGLLPVAPLVAMVFSQQFYVPLGAHLRHSVPEHLLARAASLFALVAVTAIPLLQLGFGAVLDIGAPLGWAEAGRFGLVFGGMGVLVALCAAEYACGPPRGSCT